MNYITALEIEVGVYLNLVFKKLSQHDGIGYCNPHIEDVWLLAVGTIK